MYTHKARWLCCWSFCTSQSEARRAVRVKVTTRPPSDPCRMRQQMQATANMKLSGTRIRRATGPGQWVWLDCGFTHGRRQQLPTRHHFLQISASLFRSRRAAVMLIARRTIDAVPNAHSAPVHGTEDPDHQNIQRRAVHRTRVATNKQSRAPREL